MLKLSSDLNFPWEQIQYTKVYKGVLALGSHKTHYITAPSGQTAMRSCVSSAYSVYIYMLRKISGNEWEFTELQGQDWKDGEIVKEKGQLFCKYFDTDQTTMQGNGCSHLFKLLKTKYFSEHTECLVWTPALTQIALGPYS